MASGSLSLVESADKQDVMERCIIMGEVLAEIATAGYVYTLSKGSTSWLKFPPPQGTQMNCEAAAYLLKWLAEKRGIRGGLRIVKFSTPLGFMVEAAPGLSALGTTPPEVITPELRCWEFDNHYRVRDTEQGDKAYDAIFGTSGAFNPEGVLCTKQTLVPGGMVGEYGEKYRITRTTKMTKVELMSGKTKSSKVDARYVISDPTFELVLEKNERAKPASVSA
jgi:hypothetical protein